jgi:hypothetical protein
MIKSSKELFEHKEDYEEMFSVLKKYEDLPCVDQAILEVENCLEECKNYERWKINKPYFKSSYQFGLPCLAYLNERNYIEHQGNETIFIPLTTFFDLQFPMEELIFSEVCPKTLFSEFYEELKEVSKPKYADDVFHILYYTEENAGNAYEVVKELYNKYNERYKAEAKKQRVEQLKAELAKLEEDEDDTKTAN